MSFLDFFREKQPTVETAYDKAERAGWQIEESGKSYTVHGVNHEGKADSWQFGPDEVEGMNYLLDHKLSVDIGEQYRLATYGPDEPAEYDEAVRRRHEIRDYRVEKHYSEEYKPGWKRLLGL
jgi:hypothetical protein